MAAFAAALLAMLVTGLFIDGASVFAALGVGLAFWLVCGALTDLAVKSGFGNVAPAIMLRRFAGLPRSVFGTALAHLGLGLTMLGIVGTLCFGTEKILSMHAGETRRTLRPYAAFRRALSGARAELQRGSRPLSS